MSKLEHGVVVLLHGAGLDPRLFEPVMSELPMPSIAPLRPAYGTASGEVPTVEQQAIAVLERLDEWASSVGNAGDDVTLVGVSGGATIGLAAAIALAGGAAASRPVAAIVSHEPLLGPLAPTLHATVTSAADGLASTGDVPTFLASLVGTATWHALPESARRFAQTHRDTVVADVDRFVTYAPTRGELARLDAHFTTSVGEHSGEARRAAARVLLDAGAAGVATVPGASHLAHWEAPGAFAELIVRVTPCRPGGRR